jgi:hypothetical protein
MIVSFHIPSNSLFINHPIIHCYIVELQTALSNKPQITKFIFLYLPPLTITFMTASAAAAAAEVFHVSLYLFWYVTTISHKSILGARPMKNQHENIIKQLLVILPYLLSLHSMWNLVGVLN